MRRRSLVSFALVTLFLGRRSLGAQDSTAAGVRVHIAVQARQLDGEPLDALKQGDFEVSANGRRLPVSVTQPTTTGKSQMLLLPTHVLLLFAPDSDYVAEQAVVKLLLKELPESFGNTEIAVLARSGEITDFSETRTKLIGQVQAFHKEHLSVREALARLNKFPGRRVVLYVTEKGTPVPTSLRRAAASVAALVYQVGGSPYTNYVQGQEQSVSVPAIVAGQGGFLGPADELHGGVGESVPQETFTALWYKSVRDVVRESSVKSAFRAVSRDGLGFYDLTLTVPEHSPFLDLKLHVKHDYQLTAQGYDEDSSVALPAIRLPTRQ